MPDVAEAFALELGSSLDVQIRQLAPFLVTVRSLSAILLI